MSTDKPIILLVFANDPERGGRPLRYLADERKAIEAKLKKVDSEGLCEVITRMNTTSDYVVRTFQENRNQIAIFHYGGHANGYSLLFESADASVEQTDANSLAEFFGQQSGLKFVFLNGCSTQEQVEGLLDAGVSAVVATSRAIDDKVATEFAENFYQSLALGATLRTAFSEAESSVTMTRSGNSRSMYFRKDKREDLDVDRFPWELHVRPGSEIIEDWNLPDAANDPLFGLPPLPIQDLPSSPFRNLAWFERKHADLFFGRGREIHQLYSKVTTANSAPIILYYGQSGVGKSSLLDAGLLPRLEQEFETNYVRRDHEIGLLQQCMVQLDPAGTHENIGDAWRDREKSGKPLLLVVDQVEEVFTRPNPDNTDELAEFIAAVRALFYLPHDRPRGRLMLAFRKEWLAEIEDKLVAHELPHTKAYLERLSRQGIIEVVSGPCTSSRCREQYNLELEDGLAEIIADDLLVDEETAIAPTLQVLLTRMWKEAQDNNYDAPRFDRHLYQELHRQGILLDDFLRMQISKIQQELNEAVESGLLFDFLVRHTTPLGTAQACSQHQTSELYSHQTELIDKLRKTCIEEYLLTVPPSKERDADPGTRLSHDILAPVVRSMVANSEFPGQRARRCLDSRIREWNATKDSKQPAVLDEFALKLVEDGQGGAARWNELESEFINASKAAHQAKQPPKLTREIFPAELVVKKFVPNELLIVRTADLSFQPLTYLETSGGTVIAYSVSICLVGLGILAQVVIGFMIAAGLVFMARTNPDKTINTAAFIFRLVDFEHFGWQNLINMGLVYIALTGLNLLATFFFYLRQPVRFDLVRHRGHTTGHAGAISAAIESISYGVEEAETDHEIVAIDHMVLIRRPLIENERQDDSFLRFYRSLCFAMRRSTVENLRLPPPKIYPAYPIVAFFVAIASYSFVLGPLGILVGAIGLWRYRKGYDHKGWETSLICLCVGLLTTPMLVFAALSLGTIAKVWFFGMIIPSFFFCVWKFTILRAFGDSPIRKKKTSLERLFKLRTP